MDIAFMRRYVLLTFKMRSRASMRIKPQENKKKPNPNYIPPASVLTKDPILKFEYVFTNGSSPRNEYEIKRDIVSELEKLKSESPGSVNTISIDYAISIVNRA